MSTRTRSRPRLRRWSIAVGAAAALTASTIVFSQMAFAATLFSDNFESSSIGSWSKSGGTWAVATDGSKVAQQSNAGSTNARIFAGSTSWTNITVQARVKPTGLNSGGFVALLARASGSTTFYRLALMSGNQVQLQAVKSGAVTVLASASRTVSTGTWYSLSVTASGTTVSGSVDGAQIGSGTSSVVASGRMGLQTASAAASFDDVVVTDAGGATPTSATPSRTVSPTPSRTASPTPSTPIAGWPTPTGQVSISATVSVSGTLDGGMKRYCCIGSGSQSESQDPMFDLAAGATLQNVIIGAPAGDGVHCAGSCTLRNVWWEDVGEDAATFRGSGSPVFLVDGGGARSASDKVFQHNGAGTLTIQNFQVSNFGKLYRSCGNCSTQYQRRVVIQNVTATAPGDALAGVNTNYGDSARFSNITIVNDPSKSIDICLRYTGNNTGDEPTQTGSGADGTYCIYSASDIHYQ